MLHCIGGFYFFVWLDLPLYFMWSGKRLLAFEVFVWKVGSYVSCYIVFRINAGLYVSSCCLWRRCAWA